MDRALWLQAKKKAAVERYNTLFALIYDESWGSYINSTHEQIVREIVSLLPHEAKVLDAACGTGKYWPLIAEHGHKIIGADQSAAMLERLKAKYPEAMVVLQSLQELDVGIRADLILCVDAMENIPPEDWPHVLAAFNKHLQLCGLLYITVEIEDETGITEAYNTGLEQGLPVTYGEVALTGYHYHPTEGMVLYWLSHAGYQLDSSVRGDGYWHLVARKYKDI